MIVVNRNWLIFLGMPTAVALALEETRGLMLAGVDTFAAGFGGGRYTTELARETQPSSLLLLGMADRHGASPACLTIEVGIDGGGALRLPSPSERQVAIEQLAAIDHPSASAIVAAIHEAPPCA
jgi:hypothetical protein